MNERAIFMEALDKVSLAERSAYLEEACGGDTALRQRVEALLTSHEQAGSFLGKPVPERLAEGLAAPEDSAETQGEPPAADGGAEGLDFLTPSDKPGFLGRLGHYEVLELLGRGGFGVVLKAFDERLHRVVAVKVMAPRLTSTSPARKRFLREARASAAIRHDSVVGIHAVEDQPIPYLVMEYVAGETLQQKLDRVGPLDVAEVLRIGRQIASGLAAAHALGLIHRDVKPANVLMENGIERVKITDFGLARAADDASLTQSGTVAGTPMYMAPEQARGEALDHRADLFSLGSVLYVMCSGRPPFRASTTLLVLKRVAEDTPRPIREIIPEVPEWLCAIIAKLHAKRPEDRFGSAAEVADLLTRCLSELQQHGRVQSSGLVPPVAPAADAPSPAPAALGVGKRRLRWLAPLVGAAVLPAALGLVGLLLVQALRPPSRGEPPADPKAPVVFRVEANQPWQDTGVDVVEGQAIVLTAQGTWSKGQQTCPAGGLEQASREGAVWPEAPLLCLLVRIGDEPAPTPVGQREVFKPQRSGRLFVQANDVDLEGNIDRLQLTITGGLHLGDAAPPPKLLPAQAADRDWKSLLARAEASGVKSEQVRGEVIDYLQMYARTPHVARAAQLQQQLLNLPPLVNGIGMKLAPIPPGKFLMGSPDGEPGREAYEGPRHEVVLARPFYMAIHDVTVGQFKAFVKDKAYPTEAERTGEGADVLENGQWGNDPQANWRNPGFEQTDEHPVICVSWNDARAFCEWLSEKEGKKYTLPTEAQWEYACRAGSQTKFYFGDDDEELGQYAWYWHGPNTELKPHPVGEKKPNAWGLYDMHGNVWQWTADRYAADYYRKSPKEDPSGSDVGGTRVMRGGGWDHAAFYCRAAWRHVDFAPFARSTDLGFRVVLLP